MIGFEVVCVLGVDVVILGVGMLMWVMVRLFVNLE